MFRHMSKPAAQQGRRFKSERLPPFNPGRPSNFDYNMRLSIISILLVFISTVCALPSLPRYGNDIQTISVCPVLSCTTPNVSFTRFSQKRGTPETIAELEIQLGLAVKEWKDLKCIWDNNRGTSLGWTETSAVYESTRVYNDEHVRIAGFFLGSKKEEVIKEAMSLQAVGRLRAFAENPDVNLHGYGKYPGYIMIIVPKE